MPSRRFPVGLTVATLAGLAILCSLGVWQVRRLHWKEGLLARIAALQAAPARPIEPVPTTPMVRSGALGSKGMAGVPPGGQ